jgi:hypothetical protein
MNIIRYKYVNNIHWWWFHAVKAHRIFHQKMTTAFIISFVVKKKVLLQTQYRIYLQ